MTSFEDITRAVPTLTPGQRADLMGRLKLLDRPSPDTRTALDIVHPYMARLWADATPPLFALRRHKRCKTLEEQCQHVVTFVSQQSKGDRRLFQAMVDIVLRACVRGVEARSLPFNVWTLGNMMGKLGEVLEESFPGYVQSGLFRHIPSMEGRG